MVTPIENTTLISSTSEDLLKDDVGNRTTSRKPPNAQDSIRNREPVRGFSYVKAVVLSLGALFLFGVAMLLTKWVWKNEDRQAELDKRIAAEKRKLDELKS